MGVTAIAGETAGSELQIRRSTIDSGGGETSGSEFTLRGTIGQTDTASMAGSVFTLRGGFWSSQGELPGVIFKDGFEAQP